MLRSDNFDFTRRNEKMKNLLQYLAARTTTKRASVGCNVCGRGINISAEQIEQTARCGHCHAVIQELDQAIATDTILSGPTFPFV